MTDVLIFYVLFISRRNINQHLIKVVNELYSPLCIIFCRLSFFLETFFFTGSSSFAFATTSSFSDKITSMWQGLLM